MDMDYSLKMLKILLADQHVDEATLVGFMKILNNVITGAKLPAIVDDADARKTWVLQVLGGKEPTDSYLINWFTIDDSGTST